MTAQEVFYIIGSITLAVFLLFILGAALFIYSLHQKITRMQRMAHFLGSELGKMLREGKSYGRYLGASLGTSILGKLLKILR
jgi:hypothetical protein